MKPQQNQRARKGVPTADGRNPPADDQRRHQDQVQHQKNPDQNQGRGHDPTGRQDSVGNVGHRTGRRGV